MENIMKPVLEVKEFVEEQGYARFVCDSLAKGEATVLGNSLRRILLSSMPWIVSIMNFLLFPG